MRFSARQSRARVKHPEQSMAPSGRCIELLDRRYLVTASLNLQLPGRAPQQLPAVQLRSTKLCRDEQSLDGFIPLT